MLAPWPGQSNGVYMNPSMSSLYANPNSSNIDLNSFAQNGSINPQQAFGAPQQTYNVNPVVPSKRARPSEDQMHHSPHAPSQSLDMSRSQTPMQAGAPFGAFNPQQQQQQPFQAPPTPYQHLQQNTSASANATPSPTMQPQQFRPPQQPPQRMSTASPATFAQTMSPAPSTASNNMMQPGNFNPQQSFGGNNFNPPFNPQPTICGRPLPLYIIWVIVLQHGGSTRVTQFSGWPTIAQKVGFNLQQYPTAANELQQLFDTHLGQYERRPAPTPTANGMTTPQAALQQSALAEFRRTSSVGKIDSVPPPDQEARVSASPAIKAQSEAGGTPGIKREASAAELKHITGQETEYEPHRRTLDYYGGYDILPLAKLGGEISRLVPAVPMVDEMGLIDIRALTLSLQSGIHAETRHALDNLIMISVEPRIILDLEKCEDLTDVLVDCGEAQLDILADGAAEVSDGLDLPSYEDLVRLCRIENESLQDVPAVGTQEYELDRAAERLVGVTTLLRNFSFNEANHRLLSASPVVNFVSNALRLLGTRNTFLRNSRNVADFYKDIVTFLSNISGILELPNRDDALHILQFILAFAPHPAPKLSSDSPLHFNPYVPLAQRHLPLAVDCLAKLLARQEPNRSLYRSIFSSSQTPNSSESVPPEDLLTSAFALSISVLPERSKRVFSTTVELKMVEARKALLTQGMLAADILASMLPTAQSSDESDEKNLACAWLGSDDRWPGGLLRMAFVLSVDRSAQAQRPQPGHPHMQQLDPDMQSYGLITHRGLGMLARLVEKAGLPASEKARSNSDDEESRGDGVRDGSDDEDQDEFDDYDKPTPSWIARCNPAPQRETVLGALLSPDADKVALKLLCKLYDMASA
ncbi:hypothetical protein D6C84_01797 [Aureobasidium pullulans]|uniref:ARID domain-containing protein n=1 Tax=Aureobasidium pullulans TaxID=5580 RepID=A0A4S9Y8G5_AURPU|nr:hypothetical protein D6C84_01797 [Aureobasidium pullulans]